MKPRNLVTLRELIARLRQFAPKLEPERTVFTDLRLGSLGAVARYPRYLDAPSDIPTSHWEKLSFEEFHGEPNRGGQFDDIFVPASIFVALEKKRLSAGMRAIRAKKLDLLDEPLRALFEGRGWLDDDSKLGQIDSFYKEAQATLDRDLPDKVITTAYVRAEHVPSYLAEVEGRLGPGILSEGFRWKEIYEQLVQMLLKDPAALALGRVDGTLKQVRNWALGKYPHSEVPAFKTLRAEVDANIIHVVRQPKGRKKS